MIVTTPPTTVDPPAEEQFRASVRDHGLDPDDPWIGGYVSYEWTHGRYLFESYLPSLEGQNALEFGCNIGASGIVLAWLGARVTGIDIDANNCEIARHHAAAYGMQQRIKILHAPDTRTLPLESERFDLVVCNSVLEYVDPMHLAAIQSELSRVTAPGGIILVLGTSNRFWPREVHSKRWGVNYLPRWIDPLLGIKDLQRGISPFTVTQGFPGFDIMDLRDGGEAYLAAKARMGQSTTIIKTMRAINRFGRIFGLSAGMLMPSFTIAFKKAQVR